MAERMMSGLLGPLILTAAVGGATGLAVRRGLQLPRPAMPVAVAAGVAGGVAAGFLLPQTGLAVSRSLAMGLAVTVAGAALVLFATRHMTRGFGLPGWRLKAFSSVSLLGVWLCLLDAALILVSLGLAKGHAPVGVSAVVAGMFVAAAFLLFDLRRHLTDAVTALGCDPALAGAARSLQRLLLPMIVGTTALDAVLLLTAVVFADRMRQGFAIFG